MAVRGTYSLAGEDKQAQQDTDGADDRCRKSYNANQEKGGEGSLDEGIAGFDADAKWREESVHGGLLLNNTVVANEVRWEIFQSCSPSSASGAAVEAHWLHRSCVCSDRRNPRRAAHLPR